MSDEIYCYPPDFKVLRNLSAEEGEYSFAHGRDRCLEHREFS